MPRRSVISGSRRSVTGAARKVFQIEGLEEVQERLGKIIDGVTGAKAKDVYYEGGRILRDAAKSRAPYDPGRERGTHLRDAIFVDRGDENKPNVLVGVRYRPAGAPHAHLVEYGSVKAPAQPFMRPAISASGSKISSTIKQGLLKIVDDATRR